MTEQIPPPRGHLKIYLGYASGVGKTYKMLTEVHVLKRHSVDMVVGYFELNGRNATIALMYDLELIPRRKISFREAVFEELDPEAIPRTTLR
ncbi:MAG TPA: hypothetical protein VKV95_12150 [Terriglobia bacterium]|nr:hypothetical protein [Terriglobia bacterium]